MRRHYLTDMGYERRTDYVNMLFPFTWKWDAALFALGALGLIVSIMKRRRTGVWLGLMTLIYGVWIIVWPQSMFWNARLTPFYYICRYLLAAIGAAEIGLWMASTSASAVHATGQAVRHCAHTGHRRGDLHRDPRHEPAHPPGRPHRPEADLDGQRRRVQLARAHEHARRVRRRLGQVELLGVRGQARVRRVPRGHGDDAEHRRHARMRPG